MAIHPKYAETVNKSARWAAGIGVPGSIFPPFDLAAMSIIWVNMTRKIAKISGHKISLVFALKLIYSVSVGSLLYIGGSKLINVLLHTIPGAGTVTAAGANAVFNYIYTNRLGNMLVSQFEKPNLDTSNLLTMARTIGLAVFVDVSAGEVEAAYGDIGDQVETVSAESTASEFEINQTNAQPLSAEEPANSSPKSEVKFGGYEGRFDVEGVVSSNGNSVASDSAGNMWDKETGEGVSKY